VHICIANHLETTPLLSEYEWRPSTLQNSYAISHPTTKTGPQTKRAKQTKCFVYLLT
jgi:hypothetical protein